MITEDHLKQLALGCTQHAGWVYIYGPDIAPGANMPGEMLDV